MTQQFWDYISLLPGLDLDRFVTAMNQRPSVSIKLNRRKCESIERLGYGSLRQVKWCRSGYYLENRPVFTLNPLLHAGAFYVQDASSMIYETLVDKLFEDGMLPAEPAVLDLCAAPGGKTTSVINALPDGSGIIANEFVPQRTTVLRENLIKWGYPDIMITNSPTSKFADMGEMFDLVAVDAPCSGEGMMRKEQKAVEQWSLSLIRQCRDLQREILGDAVKALKPGGVLIYSTCTFNSEEDEDNVEWVMNNYGLESVRIDLPDDWGIGRSINPNLPAMRFMPHLTRGEGLFVAVLRKPGHSAASDKKEIFSVVRRHAKVILDGIPVTTSKGKIEIPASESVLATDYDRSSRPETEVDEDTALRYLRHEALQLPPDIPKGFVTVSYKGYPLGLVKNIGSRANNLYPAAWRIRMNIE